VLEERPEGLCCPAGDFYIDPWGPVDRAVITHAHGDHARPGSRSYLCVDSCRTVLERRLQPEAIIEAAPYNRPLRIGDVTVSFHPAGHILGSAQVRIAGPQGVWVVSGDYKREPDPTCEPFEPVGCDTFVTESTFGLPIFRWDRASEVVAGIHQWWEGNAGRGVTSLLFCYALGKAQRILASLAELTDRPVLVHGAMAPMIDIYRRAGIRMLRTEVLVERAKGQPLTGELVLAPLSARGTPWMRRLGEFSDGFASGTMRVRGMRRQRNVDRGFVLSDHADWPALLQTVKDTGASRVLTTHGYPEPLARYLRSQGIDSGVIRSAWDGEAASP
jgi:putative mRNA 3-end processing factor